jgi:recombination protein RecR
MYKKEKLEELFREFPGIGPRQAKRFVHSLLYKNKSYLNEMAKLISEIKDGTRKCTYCNRFYQSENVASTCSICSDTNRDQSKILIIEKTPDFENIELSHIWNGKYYLIGKNLKLTEKQPQEKIDLEALISTLNSGVITELTFALSLNPEGENTKDYIHNEIKNICSEKNISVTELGRGLSLGSEIEYSDTITLAEAFKNRK